MLFRFIIFLLFFYLIIRFVTRFLIPIFKVVNTANESIKQAKEQMQRMEQHKKNQQQQQQTKTEKIDGEYIDYEEVKS